MLPRYSLPEMAALWTEEAKYNSWAQVEESHLKELVAQGQAPATVVEACRRACATKTPADYLKREEETAHDVIAFVAEVGEAMGPLGAYFHKGLTSSDVLDTALALRLRDSLTLVGQALKKLALALAKEAFSHAGTLTMGRSHGIHGEPISFGHILAGHFAEFHRCQEELQYLVGHLSYGKMSGAMGNYSQLPPAYEAGALAQLGLKPEPVATQVVPRDRLARLGAFFCNCANGLERLATNARHWGRTEVGEVLEPFGKKQKGSSAMPHKKNPILSENITGLCRIVRHWGTTLQDNTVLWHERDMSHSSVERMALPDGFTVLHFALHRMAALVDRWEVNTQAMAHTVGSLGGVWLSQTVLTALVERGVDRTQAYELVQQAALPLVASKAQGKVLEGGAFVEALAPLVSPWMGRQELEALQNPQRFLGSVGPVFQRVFGAEPTLWHNPWETLPVFQTHPWAPLKGAP